MCYGFTIFPPKPHHNCISSSIPPWFENFLQKQSLILSHGTSESGSWKRDLVFVGNRKCNEIYSFYLKLLLLNTFYVMFLLSKYIPCLSLSDLYFHSPTSCTCLNISHTNACRNIFSHFSSNHHNWKLDPRWWLITV